MPSQSNQVRFCVLLLYVRAAFSLHSFCLTLVVFEPPHTPHQGFSTRARCERAGSNQTKPQLSLVITMQ